MNITISCCREQAKVLCGVVTGVLMYTVSWLRGGGDGGV